MERYEEAIFVRQARAKSDVGPRRSFVIAMTIWSMIIASAIPAQEVLPRPTRNSNDLSEQHKDSTPDKNPLFKAPQGAPNVLVILDDSGFGGAHAWLTYDAP